MLAAFLFGDYMRKWLAAGLFLAAVGARAQTAVLPIYACTLPGVQALVSGISSTNYLYGIIRSCKVTVYLTGTTTIATTTPQSPFTANTNGSIPPIYAPTSTCYDVVLSGGIAPNNYPTPVTLTDVCPGGGGGGGGGNQVSVAAIASPFVMAGTQQLFDAIPSVTPVCDIRTQGAVIDGVTDIGPAVQACVNLVNSLNGASGTILFPCVGSGGGPGCYWANPSALTPGSGEPIFLLQGGIQLGSTLVAPYWEQWKGDWGNEGNAFATGGGQGLFFAPAVNGTIGTAVSTAPSTQVTITPTFTNGTIANLPPGSAITIAGTTSSSGYGSTHKRCRIRAGCPDDFERDPHSSGRTHYHHRLLGFVARLDKQRGECCRLFRQDDHLFPDRRHTDNGHRLHRVRIQRRCVRVGACGLLERRPFDRLHVPLWKHTGFAQDRHPRKSQPQFERRMGRSRRISCLQHISIPRLGRTSGLTTAAGLVSGLRDRRIL